VRERWPSISTERRSRNWRDRSRLDDEQAQRLFRKRDELGGRFESWDDVKAACGFGDDLVDELRQQAGLTLEGADDLSGGGNVERRRSGSIR
jgi:hypothetical protein